MRSRSNSGVRLDYYQRIVHRLIMRHQQPVTGLFPASPQTQHAWIRDNVYCILAVWGLSMAYKKIADQDEDRAKAYELEQCCVKLMRGLLMAMMNQKEKVERFKTSQNPLDSLHAKYSSRNGQIVVGDSEWGHLQIDAISLYLLILAQMTASGLQIVFSLDEVAFIQNLVFYIESAYCIPDYGIWERGDKSNHGQPELNASSIGMAKAALEAMNELDLFGARGGSGSVIHVLADEAHKCQAVLQSMLPRESNSKELDAGLLSVVGFPAFACDDPQLIETTQEAIITRLQGRYGCKRFLRDGYKTPKEDNTRLYYERWELRMFEKIECEWPLFFCYLILNKAFQNDKQAVAEYSQKLEDILVKTEEGMKLIPELYAVPEKAVAAEYQAPGSQQRVVVGRCPFLWGQSLYILGKLLQEGFLAVGELDPLNRRLGAQKKPDVVVQVVILAEDNDIRDKLAEHGIQVQTIADVAPIEVQPARVLSHLYTYLGRNKKLGLSGRKSRDVGILSTSKLYSLKDRIFAFTPQFSDVNRFYIASDNELMIDLLKGEINFLKSAWQNLLGRPLLTLVLKTVHLDNNKVPLAMIQTMKKLKSGYISGTRVILGNLGDFINTSAITDLSFLGSQEDGYPDKLNPAVQAYLDEHLLRSFSHRASTTSIRSSGLRPKNLRRRMSVKGAIKKTRSINVDSETLGMEGNVTERRLSHVTPQWLEPNQTTVGAAGAAGAGTGAAATGPSGGSPTSRDPSPNTQAQQQQQQQQQQPRYGTERVSLDDDGKKLHIQTSATAAMPKIHIQPLPRHRPTTETNFENTEVEELIAMLRETENLEEQGDILQHLVDTQGLDFNTGMLEEGRVVTVRGLLKGLYEKACQQKMWGLVRHTAGMLGKRVEDLAKAVTDLLVRQKQVTVGMPPNSEHTITAPLPEMELRAVIHEAYGDDESTAMLSQELLVYLAMFIRTEPQLFHEMLRLRVGLIIQVMAKELSRTLNCDGEQASEHLLNLSPFEMKNLLHHILSGKEFAINSVARGNISIVSCKSSRVSKKSQIGIGEPEAAEGSLIDDRQGQWLRRRRLDGALNRVPRDFYPRVWTVLERCSGLAIEGRILPQSLTQEMTPNELKFALEVETALNTIPQPEYRQLVVEALMVLTLVTEHNILASIGTIIYVEHLVHRANQLFLEDQRKSHGDAMLCCAKNKDVRETTTAGLLLCGGAAYICQHLYDSAPSGSYGTMTYMARAVASVLELPKHGDMDCTIS
ncbi:probable phosphorylase b kinase regulatory subunit alpha isoform X3 [Anopheles arabiensis]|uniref:probable phosphorylase b kinase regulatory subunit alpha isoform X3 n=1 Tax=Anopheles arabiensis TaxID=7173 RepID=UPI001AAD42EC|nr:probable phosphorylase b kinase regulatory subunit alpha isoform X3 [Anopheles arabiensis]